VKNSEEQTRKQFTSMERARSPKKNQKKNQKNERKQLLKRKEKKDLKLTYLLLEK
jgi:hypothetical protein